MKTILMGFLAAGLLAAGSARADEPAIIAKARAYLGTEAALTGVRTIHFSGTLVQGAAPGPAAHIEIYFEAPWRERIEARAGSRLVETALDGFDGWQRSRDGAAAAPRFAILGAPITESLRADTWENLNFYRGIERAQGRVEDGGAASVDGLDCEKVIFIHGPGIVYVRYFDWATGRLVATETAAGVEIREEGSIVSGGIRFPRSITTRQRDASGQVQVSVYTFDSIKVNEALPDRYFTVPLTATAP